MKNKFLLVFIINLMLLVSCAPVTKVETVTEQIEQDETSQLLEGIITEEQLDETEVAVEVSFSGDIWPVIKEFALEAHGGKGGVFLESYEDIIKYVVPGDPEGSRLYQTLTGNGAPQMPPSGPLPAETIQLFYDWIQQGAKNN